MKLPENPSMKQQMEAFERERQSEEDSALNQLLKELEKTHEIYLPLKLFF